jgi:hypothetical protein
VTDRERARLIGLLREAARALRPASTYDAWLPERLKREADELARGAYELPRKRSETPNSSENPEMQNASTSAFGTKTAGFCDETRDDRRDHDRHPARVL